MCVNQLIYGWCVLRRINRMSPVYLRRFTIKPLHYLLFTENQKHLIKWRINQHGTVWYIHFHYVWIICWCEAMKSVSSHTPTWCSRKPTLSQHDVQILQRSLSMHKVSALTVTSSDRKTDWYCTLVLVSARPSRSARRRGPIPSLLLKRKNTQCWRTAGKLKWFGKARVFLLFRCWNFHEISCRSSRNCFSGFSYIYENENFTSVWNKGIV